MGNADLGAFLRQAASEPFSLGEWDCAMTVANWVRDVRGADPAAALRGRYRTRMGWLRIVKRNGGLPALVGRLAKEAGMTETADPRHGDIGVVDVPGVGHCGAIRTERGWAVKVDGGLLGGSIPTVIMAWRFAEIPTEGAV